MDYISRETAKHDIVAWARVITQPDLLSRDDALTALDCIPAADVRPVIRGEWKEIITHNGCTPDYDCLCSCCGESGIPSHKFCPNCGAEMKGGQDNA